MGKGCLLQVSHTVKYQLYDGEYILLNIKSGDYYHLDNETSIYIWSLLRTSRSIKEIMSLVLKRFEGDKETIIDGVTRFIRHLEKEKLVNRR